MNRVAALSLAALALSACQKTVAEMTWPEKKQLAQEIIARCEKDGEKQGTPSFDACARSYVNQEIAQRQDARNRAREAGLILAAGIANASAGYGAAASASRPVSCTSNRYGSTVTTNCY
jgi:hypothetical protein